MGPSDNPHVHRRADDPEPNIPVPLTDEQLAFFTEQTRKAVHKAVGRFVRGATVGFLILLFGVGYAIEHGNHQNSQGRQALVDSGRAVAVDGCNRDFRDKDDFRGLLIRLKVANDASYAANKARITPAEHNAATSFYLNSLAAETYPDCGAARNLITDDTSQRITVPVPLTTSNAKNADIGAAEKRIQSGG